MCKKNIFGKNMSNDSDLPFFEYEIIEINGAESKKEILLQLERHLRSFNPAAYSWVGSLDNPKLKLEYKDNAEFLEINTRSYPFFSMILDFIESNKILLRELQFQEKDSCSQSNENVYLILKIHTNRISELRQNYSFSAKFAEFVKLAIMYEEVKDGFLIFYKTREAFEDAQVNRFKFDELKHWLQKKGLWHESYAEIFEAIMEKIQMDARIKQRKKLNQASRP
jgi:hypothetical protein